MSLDLVFAIVTCVGLVAGLPPTNFDANGGALDPEINASESAQPKRIYVRTENYPRPPYSGATYYIYEKDDKVICTKFEVCNKFNDCTTSYKKGIFKEQEDIDTGEPYGKTDRVAIAGNKLKKHVCLTKFKLIP